MDALFRLLKEIMITVLLISDLGILLLAIGAAIFLVRRLCVSATRADTGSVIALQQHAKLLGTFPAKTHFTFQLNGERSCLPHLICLIRQGRKN
jgi:hypothetical protein